MKQHTVMLALQLALFFAVANNANESCAFSRSAQGDETIDWGKMRNLLFDFVETHSLRKGMALHGRLQRVYTDTTSLPRISADFLELAENALPKLYARSIKHDSVAIKLLFDLSAIADGHLAEEIDGYLGEFVKIDPQRFLCELVAHDFAYRAKLGYILNPKSEAYEDSAECEVEIHQRINSLLRVKSLTLKPARDSCVARLTELLGEDREWRRFWREK